MYMLLLPGDIITEYDDMIPSYWLLASLRSLVANEVFNNFHVSRSDVQLNISANIIRCVTANSCLYASRMLAAIILLWLHTFHCFHLCSYALQNIQQTETFGDEAINHLNQSQVNIIQDQHDCNSLQSTTACSTHGREDCIKAFVGKEKGEKLLGRQTCRRGDIIKMYLTEIECRCKHWIYLPMDTDKWQVRDIIMNFRSSIRFRKILE